MSLCWLFRWAGKDTAAGVVSSARYLSVDRCNWRLCLSYGYRLQEQFRDARRVCCCLFQQSVASTQFTMWVTHSLHARPLLLSHNCSLLSKRFESQAYYPVLDRSGDGVLFSIDFFVRPPGTTVPDGLMFYRRCFLFLFFRHAFSEIPQPIALKLCHVVGIWLNFINWLQKFGEYSPKKFWGPKTCEISVNFGPLQTLIANISGTRQHIQNRKDVRTRKIRHAFNEKSKVNFGLLTTWNYMWVWTH